MSESSRAVITCKLCSAEIPEETVPVWKRRHILFTAASTILFPLGLVDEYFDKSVLLGHAVFLAVILISGHEIIRNALSSLLHKRLDINFLMTIAAFGAFAIGQADEGAAVIYLFSIAEFLEVWASDKARASIATLLKLSPSSALVRIEGKEVVKHIHDVMVGETVIVKPGEKIPVDGIVVAGNSAINQAAITGESIPTEKEEGGQVFAGSINGKGFLEIKVTKPPTESVLAKVVRLVRQAQSEKSSTESIVERFSKYYTPVVVGSAVLVALLPPLILKADIVTWIYRSLILLVVSCPCALTISTPVSMVSAITGSARNGVLIKGGKHVESLAEVRMVLFDKTGTLTTGRLEVSDVVSLSPTSGEILQLAASLEAKSEHPIAKAILERANKEKLPLIDVTRFQSIRGEGITGIIDGKEILAGKRELFQDISEKTLERLEELQAQGKTAIFVGKGGKVVGIIALKDGIKNTAFRAIKELRERGVEAAVISGDNRVTTAAIAKEVGVDHYHAELLPEDKMDEVDELKKKYGKVAMVGDGVNDAPALAKASVGIVMGALGSDVSIETADIALMQDDLSKIPYALDLSRKTLQVVKQNIAASILIKAAIAILAFFGLITLAIAVGVGDMGLSLAVILNAIRLRRVSQMRPR